MPTRTPDAGSSAIELENQPRNALDTAIEAARLASPLVEGPHGARHAFVPEGFKLQDISDRFALPPSIHQLVVVDDRASLTAYANRFSDARSILIADYDSLSIRAALDWHEQNDDGLGAMPCKHSAVLRLRDSEEFTRWNKFEGELHEQAVFAAFLEENAVDVVRPEPAALLEIARDLEATQGVAFKSSTRLESGDRAFAYETETHVKGDVKVPREFWLSIPLFVGEEPVEIRAALRFRPRADGLFLGFEWRRVEYQRQAHFAQIATAAAEGTGLPVFFGRAA